MADCSSIGDFSMLPSNMFKFTLLSGVRPIVSGVLDIKE